jgi:hypothetical protein
MPFYQAKLLCRFVTTKFSPLVEFAGISNAAVTWADCIFQSNNVFSLHVSNLDTIYCFVEQESFAEVRKSLLKTAKKYDVD